MEHQTSRRHKKPARLAAEVVHTIENGYGTQDVPIVAYAALMGAYSVAFATLLHFATKDGRELKKPSGLDLALLTVASYKLSRVVTMSFIAAPLRAPFTHRGKSLRGGEVQDEARGRGLQRAIGSLVTCPFCFSVWSTTGFVFGYSLAPKVTIQAATIFSIAAAQDFLHHAYRNLREASV